MKKHIYILFLLLLLLGLSQVVKAQVPPPPPPPEPEPEIFVLVEEKAQPIGGYKAFYRHIARSLRYRYPSLAYRNRVQGVVLIEFVVHKNGRLSNMKVLKSVGSGCDEVALQVLRRAPKWRPAIQRGRPTQSKCRIPIRFQIL
ncbi:energy transducer TonB [Microscilla marina]|uniref:TonB n=1 Tax=Microscilla marina ATCC 23134 TaxID=313606 RepID=A1ZD51_MICM2|nr:energy transducer TonB [Microscilla marina]EAY31590.1 TonB [Microscilla marina ATCC 23134]